MSSNSSAPDSDAWVDFEDWTVSEGDEVEHAAIVLRDCLSGAHRFLAEVAGEEHADAAMTSLLSPMFEREVRQLGWRETLFEREGGLLSELPMGELLALVSGYAHHGRAIMSETAPEDRRARLAKHLQHFERFLALVPVQPWGLDLGAFEETVLMARGRWALDNGEPIEPKALALFGGVSERRIRNMMSKTEGAFPNADGAVPARDALEWLRHRKSFRPSAWLDDKRLAFLAGPADYPSDDVRFVPVGADGGCFHPGLKRDGFYQIGERGDEQAIGDYEAALASLQRMPIPIWRRPTPGGHWTLVRGVRWERMLAHELQILATEDASGRA